MKTWIIVLTIAFIVLRFVTNCIANYIKGDPLEKLKYKVLDGTSTLGVWHGLLYLLGTLVGFADAILVLITLVNKIM